MTFPVPGADLDDPPREVLAPLRVAAVQAVSVAGEVKANVAAAAEWVQRSVDAGAALVVLPELFLSGYDPDTQRADPDGCDVTPEDPRLDPLREAGRAAAILVGAAVRQPDQTRTVSVLSFDRSGDCAVAYSKQHLWDEERSIFVPGTSGATVALGDWELGLGVCYDGCFPEHARAASDTGALAYVCPSAYLVGSEHRRDLYYAAALSTTASTWSSPDSSGAAGHSSSAAVRRSTTRRADPLPAWIRGRGSRWRTWIRRRSPKPGGSTPSPATGWRRSVAASGPPSPSAPAPANC